MRLRSKLLLAQAPLVAGLVVCAVVANVAITRLSTSSERILQENYRSVLAAQRMKESLERIDSGALFIVADQVDAGVQQAREHAPRFEEELKVEEANVTEAGEAEAAARLRASWVDYWSRVETFIAISDPAERRRVYFDGIVSAFSRTKEAADVILTMNQDAMVHKSDAAARLGRRFEIILASVSAAALLLGLIASSVLTVRILRPLGVLTQVARRLGSGDLSARAQVQGNDEIRDLAREANAMADHLEAYRNSSIGELLQAQEASQAAIDSLPDPVVVFNASGRVTNSNKAATHLLGIDVERHPTDALSSAADSVQKALLRAHEHSAGGRGAFSPQGLDEAAALPTADGERSFLVRAMPIHSDEGGIVGATVVLQDVTRLLRIDEFKNDLVATVAHELRTPLTSLHMAIHLCLEESIGPLTHQQADLLHAARSDCDRLQNVVGELLDLSRIQAGRLVLETRPVPVESILDNVVDAQGPAAAERNVALKREALPGLGEITADVERIELVLTNLVTNAVRFSPPQSTVVIRAEAKNDCVRFEVRDQGPGVPAEYREKIFEKYFQIPGERKGGAGLGLHIAREVVEAHGGSIGIDSAAGQGATFYFELPRKR